MPRVCAYMEIDAFAYIKPYANVAGAESEVIIAGHPRKGRILDAPVYDADSLLPRTDAALEVA